MTAKKKRLDALERKQREWEAAHLPLSDVLGFLGVVLTAVQEEAGQDAFQRVAGRMVGEKARRVARLARGQA